ncbi:C4-dicarboxylate ABC transporter substrate-binding protein [Paracoccus thiocyanatus]|uniref:C4-dicarboxylate ABC transporter substrate-binding protein n=1 Tax=Paracoccus thiocyanatus TaxID=34006 RepID=A0A3D8PFE3_9RHOB|nr:C4-dicarboxylate ABC transporter substrate-binding protein [Paracoccus thiocyanatus]
MFSTASAVFLAMVCPAVAQEVVLKIQTQHAATSLQGEALLDYAERVRGLTDGSLELEILTSSAVVKASESFEAAAMGILDGDSSSATYLTGKDPAFQFYADVMGGYDDPFQILAWYRTEGGLDLANELYNAHGMQLVGVFAAMPEALSSTKPLASVEDLQGWKFRAPPGMESEIFSKLGAAPVVTPFGEVFTAMSTGAVAGTDASTLTVNRGLGIYDIAKHTTWPGFHSMPIEHVTLNLAKWNALSPQHQRAMQVALDSMALDMATRSMFDDLATARALKTEGVAIHDWSPEDRAEFRAVAQETWAEWAEKSPAAKVAYDAHIAFMTRIGLIQ